MGHSKDYLESWQDAGERGASWGKWTAFFLGAALGSLAIYLMDPKEGPGRRWFLKDKSPKTVLLH